MATRSLTILKRRTSLCSFLLSFSGCNQIWLHFELHPLQCWPQFQNKSKKVHYLLYMVQLQSVMHMCGLGHNLGHDVCHRWGVWNGAFGVFKFIGSRKRLFFCESSWWKSFRYCKITADDKILVVLTAVSNTKKKTTCSNFSKNLPLFSPLSICCVESMWNCFISYQN